MTHGISTLFLKSAPAQRHDATFASQQLAIMPIGLFETEGRRQYEAYFVLKERVQKTLKHLPVKPTVGAGEHAAPPAAQGVPSGQDVFESRQNTVAGVVQSNVRERAAGFVEDVPRPKSASVAPFNTQHTKRDQESFEEKSTGFVAQETEKSGSVAELSMPVGIPSGKTYEAREFRQFLADVRTVSELTGTNDVVVIRRVAKDEAEAYLADFDRMEGQRIVAGWIGGRESSSPVKRPLPYKDRTAINPATGRKFGPEKVFEETYAPLVDLGLVSQSDFRLLDRDFHDSYDTQLRKKSPPELLSSKFQPKDRQKLDS